MSKRRLVIGNWKLYIESPKQAVAFAKALRRKSRLFSGVQVFLAPTHTLIAPTAAALKGSTIQTAAQSASAFVGGAHTGYISARSLKEAGASFALVGHSERRAEALDGMQGAGEKNETIQAELRAVHDAGLTPILCIGEKERTQEGSHFGVLEEQLSIALHNLRHLKKLIVAYEPVWAINKTADAAMKPQELTETVIFIRKTLAELLDRKVALATPILYGGSVEPENVSALLSEGSVNGFLVGHASSDITSFTDILKACRK